MSDINLQFIPDDYWDLAVEYRFGHQNLQPGQIWNLLSKRHLDEGKGELPFDVKCLANRLQNHPGTSLHAQRLVDDLRDEQRNQAGFILDYEVDETSHALTKIFWATHEMVLAARSSAAPLLLDATYNVTKSVLKLVVPATVGPDNTTAVIGVAMIFQEDVQSWKWILENLMKVCGFDKENPQTCPLTTIICDEDRAMGSAIDAHAKACPGHFHRHICTYHLIIQNVQTTANQIFQGAGSKEQREKFMKTFWSIALDSDVRKTSLESFSKKWDKLMELLPGELGRSHKKFLDRVLDDRERWARRYTWSRMVAGMSASSRIEGLHSAVKGAIPSGNKIQLCQVPVNIQAYCNRQKASGKKVVYRASQSSQDQSIFLQELERVATPAAVNMVVEEWKKSNFYSCKEVTSKKTWWPLAGLGGQPPETFSMWTVTRNLGKQDVEYPSKDKNDQCWLRDKLWEKGGSRNHLIVRVGTEAPQCTCQYQTALGVPCRHLLAWQMLTCKTDVEKCRQLVHSWLNRHWHANTLQEVKDSIMESMASENLRTASAAVLQVEQAYTAPDGEAHMGRAALLDAAKKCTDLAWEAGPSHRKAFSQCLSSFISSILQKGTHSNPSASRRGQLSAGNPEVADPVRGSGRAISRKKRPASGRPAGETIKKGRGAIIEKVKCKACGKEISKNNITRHLKICRGT